MKQISQEITELSRVFREKKFTYRGVAENTTLSHAGVWKVLTGRASPSQDTIDQIAHAMGVEIRRSIRKKSA